MANKNFDPDIGKATRFNGDNAAINGKKGAEIASKVRKQNKTIREIMTQWSNQRITNNEFKDKMQELGFDDTVTNKVVAAMGMWEASARGNPNAYDRYTAMIGEPMPIQETTVNLKVNPFEGMTTEELRKLVEDD